MNFQYFAPQVNIITISLTPLISCQQPQVVYSFQPQINGWVSQNTIIPQILPSPILQNQSIPQLSMESQVQENSHQSGNSPVAKKQRRRSPQKELESAKKNSQSNSINQMFSFFSRNESSEKLIEKAARLLKDTPAEIQKIKVIFYNMFRLVNLGRGRKYVNRFSIRKYFTPEGLKANIPGIEEKLSQIGVLSLEELTFLFRVTTTHFFRNISINSILTSKRVSMIAKKEHLIRRRKVQAFFCSRDE